MHEGISAAAELATLEITSLRVVKIAPESGVAQAVEAPARERIKQETDEASFARRAMAVDKERAGPSCRIVLNAGCSGASPSE